MVTVAQRSALYIHHPGINGLQPDGVLLSGLVAEFGFQVCQKGENVSIQGRLAVAIRSPFSEIVRLFHLVYAFGTSPRRQV